MPLVGRKHQQSSSGMVDYRPDSDRPVIQVIFLEDVRVYLQNRQYLYYILTSMFCKIYFADRLLPAFPGMAQLSIDYNKSHVAISTGFTVSQATTRS